MRFSRLSELERARRAADRIIDEVKIDEMKEGIEVDAPNIAVGAYTFSQEKRQRRFGLLCTELARRGFDSIVYNGYVYRGDSASELRQPETVYLRAIEAQDGGAPLTPPVDVYKLWAQNHGSPAVEAMHAN